MLMLRNDLSTQPGECSGIKWQHVIKTGQFKQSRNSNMLFNCRENKYQQHQGYPKQQKIWAVKKIEFLLENFYCSRFLVSCCSHFAKGIPKSLRATFLSGMELLQFMLQIVSRKSGFEAYIQLKLFRNSTYLQSGLNANNAFGISFFKIDRLFSLSIVL